MEHNGRLSTGAWIQVNLGRNVGGAPMRPEQWGLFIGDTVRHLERITSIPADRMMHTVGTGPWEDGTEDCASIGVFAPAGTHIDGIRATLSILASIHGQDAIALMLGGELIQAAA